MDLVIVLAIGALLRLYVVWSVLTQQPRGWLFGRGLEMGWLAESLLKGQGLSNPFGPPTGPTAFIAPAYPILVAAIFKIFGTYSQASEAVLMLLHTAANLLTIALMMILARELAGRAAALIAGLVWACSLPLIWMPSIFWETSISIALLMLLLVLAGRVSKKPTLAAWIGLGTLSAFLALLNPALLLTILAVLVWLALVTWRTFPHLRSGFAISLLTFAILFSPWPIRNARVFHAFIPLRTTVGFELWMGNLPASHGYLNQAVFPSYNQHELDDYKRMGELAYTNNKSQLAKQEILADPGAFVSMTGRRFLRFWTGNGNSQGSPLYVLHATLTTLLGLLGLSALLRSRRYAIAALLALPLILFPVPYYITHAEFRYRLEIDPVLTVLAGIALVSVFRTRAVSSEESDAAA